MLLTVTRRPVLLTCAVAATLVLALEAAAPGDIVSLTVPGRSSATPWVAADGAFVAVAWGAALAGKSDVFVAVSRDAGQTFAAPVRVNSTIGEARLGGELAPRVALAPRAAGATDPEIAVLWTARATRTEIRTARSRDGGRTFGAPTTLQAPGAAGDRGWPALALDGKGAAHAIWLDHRGLASAGGTAASHHQTTEARDGVAMAQKSGLYYASAGPATSERELTPGVCYCCKTALAAGPNGALYAAWRHVYPGNMRDMAFAASRDGGRSFSAPVRVSEDKWAVDGCPDDGPAMVVDGGGTVHVVWPTVLSGPTPQAALFYASTRDGRTFTPRVRIPTLGSPKPSHPQIVVDRTGRIVVAWDELVKGARVAALREVKVAANQPASFGAVVMLSPERPAMYPVVAATDAGLLAVWASGGNESTVSARSIRLP